MTSTTFIAERELLFAKKGDAARSKLLVRVGCPYLVQSTDDGTKLDEGASACELALVGLGIGSIQFHGIDQIHALAQAADIDRYLRGLTKDFDFYWPSGEPYFEE